MLDLRHAKDTIIKFLRLSDQEEGCDGFIINPQFDWVIQCPCRSIESKYFFLLTGCVVYETFLFGKMVTRIFICEAQVITFSSMVTVGDVQRESVCTVIGNLINKRGSHALGIKGLLVPMPTTSCKLGKGTSFNPKHLHFLLICPAWLICLSASAFLPLLQLIFQCRTLFWVQ